MNKFNQQLFQLVWLDACGIFLQHKASISVNTICLIVIDSTDSKTSTTASIIKTNDVHYTQSPINTQDIYIINFFMSSIHWRELERRRKKAQYCLFLMKLSPLTFVTNNFTTTYDIQLQKYNNDFSSRMPIS